MITFPSSWASIVFAIAASSSLSAQPATGSYHYESNDGSQTGSVLIIHLGGSSYQVTHTPTGGSGTSQIMTTDSAGNLIGVGGHFAIIQAQNSATPPAMQHGTEDGQLAIGSITRGTQDPI